MITLLALALSAPLIAPASSPIMALPAEGSSAAIHLVKLKGVYADLPEAGGDLTTLLLSGAVSEPKSFYGMLEELEALREAEGETLLFDLTETFSLNLVQLSELERAVGELRRAGKRSYAYLENAASMSYQVAALCDEVIMADLGTIDLPSLAMSVTFMKDALDLLGIQYDVVRCGDFKGAVEPYTLSRMSTHLRSHYEAMLERLNHDVARRIATGRGLDIAQVRELQAHRLISARQALEFGLVDRLVPWRGAERALAEVLEETDLEWKDALGTKKSAAAINPMTFFMEMFQPPDERAVEDDALVVLHLSGQILDGHKSVPGSMVSGPSVATIEELVENDAVKGVVVRINSPGGSATASEAILLALSDLAEAKPVVVSMGRVAASGGYYITCLGRPILAEPTTITGSIGVFGLKPNLGPLLRRVGIHQELIALDDSAGMMAIDQSWSGDQKARVQEYVDHIYEVFVGHVSRSRGMPAGGVLKIAGGRVWSGEQAVEIGLVDRIGGLEDALAMVAAEAGIEGYDVQHLPRPKTFMDALTEEMMSMRLELRGSLERAALARLDLDSALRVLLDAIANESPARAWAMMPEGLSIR